MDFLTIGLSIAFWFTDSYHEDYGKKKGGSFKKGHKKGFVYCLQIQIFAILNQQEYLWNLIGIVLVWAYFHYAPKIYRYHEEEKGGKKGGGKKGHHDEDKKGKYHCDMSNFRLIIFWCVVYWMNFRIQGWHSKKGDEGEYGHKSEHGKKGGDEKFKKWGSKKGH